MLIVPIKAKRKQPHSDITFTGDAVPKAYKPADFHIDITAINCEQPKCKPRPKCESIVSKSCRCGEGHTEPTPDPKQWILRYVPTSIDHCTLTFDWCALLWDLPAAIYDAVLYRECEPCGRFRIQVQSGTVYAADRTEVPGC